MIYSHFLVMVLCAAVRFLRVCTVCEGRNRAKTLSQKLLETSDGFGEVPFSVKEGHWLLIGNNQNRKKHQLNLKPPRNVSRIIASVIRRLKSEPPFF
jgi:hypothetical protein